jgi:hypothetical protein
MWTSNRSLLRNVDRAFHRLITVGAFLGLGFDHVTELRGFKGVDENIRDT